MVTNKLSAAILIFFLLFSSAFSTFTTDCIPCTPKPTPTPTPMPKPMPPPKAPPVNPPKPMPPPKAPPVNPPKPMPPPKAPPVNPPKPMPPPRAPPVNPPKPMPPPKAPPVNPFCPRDTLKLGACADLLGGVVNIIVGSPPSSKCCTLLEGLPDLEAAACLCTAIKANVLGINLNVPITLSLLLSACEKSIPPGFQCG